MFGKMITYINQKLIEGHGQRGEAWDILTLFRKHSIVAINADVVIYNGSGMVIFTEGIR